MEVRTDGSNVYYSFNNTANNNTIKTDNETISQNAQNEQSPTNTQSSTSNVTQLPRIELPTDEVRAIYSQNQSIQLNQEILNAYVQNNNSVDFSSSNVELSLRDINQLQQQLNRAEVLENVAAVPISERGENLSEIDLEELEKLRDENQALSNEEAIALYYNRQAQESKEKQAEIYVNNINNNDIETDDSEVSLNDINDLQETLNRTQALDNRASIPETERREIPSDRLETPEPQIPEESVDDTVV